MKLIHEFGKNGWHRIVLDVAPGLQTVAGEWALYQSVATLDHAGRRFIAVNEYHGLWNNAVVEVISPIDFIQDMQITKEGGR